jgi:hypothetical protein
VLPQLRRSAIVSNSGTMEADRVAANVLNDREDRLAFLAAHRIAKNAAEKTDIVT